MFSSIAGVVATVSDNGIIVHFGPEKDNLTTLHWKNCTNPLASSFGSVELWIQAVLDLNQTILLIGITEGLYKLAKTIIIKPFQITTKLFC